MRCEHLPCRGREVCGERTSESSSEHAVPLLGLPSPGVIHQYPPHRRRYNGQEVLAVFHITLPFAAEPQPGFVNQRRWGKCVTWPFGAHPHCRNSPELTVDEFDELRLYTPIAGVQQSKKPGNLTCRVVHGQVPQLGLSDRGRRLARHDYIAISTGIPFFDL